MSPHHNCEICSNHQCFLFKNSVSEMHEELNKHKSCVQYKKGQQVIREGDPVMGMYFIQSGKVKVHKENEYRGQIIRFAKDGDILGRRGLGGENKYPISATTIEDSKICYVNQEMLFKLLRSKPELSIKMMLFYAEELKQTETRLQNMAIMTVRERIAEALLMIHNVFGVKNGKGILLDAELSRKDIAEIAGTYQEQASRFITEFKKEEILELDGKKIIIKQLNKLTEVLDKYDSP